MENIINNNDFEVRSIEIRAIEDSRTITGTAIVFNSPSQDLGGWIEEISPEACTTEFLNSQDILMLYEHEQESGILARSKKGKGTLKYNIDATGVHFEFNAKNTSLGNEVLESVKAGDLDSCSFAFRVAEGGERWENLGNGLYKRTITKFEIIRDFSIVINPAYTQTQVSNRSLEAFKAEEQRKLIEVQQQEAEQRKLQEAEELRSYYSKYDDLINSINLN